MKNKSLTSWLGLGGISESDNETARKYGVVFDRVMIFVALLTLPLLIYIFDDTGIGKITSLVDMLEWAIFLVFSLEFLFLIWLSSQRYSFLKNNWLNFLIITVSALSILGFESGLWLAFARMMRVASLFFLAARGLVSTGRWFLSRGVPIAVGLAFVAWLVSGLGFYFLEPTIASFGEGLWLAFVSASTVGYGDLVPTTATSKLFAIIMVFVGFGLFSMAIASISAYFVGEDEKEDSRRLHQDIVDLSDEIRELRSQIEKLKS